MRERGRKPREFIGEKEERHWGWLHTGSGERRGTTGAGRPMARLKASWLAEASEAEANQLKTAEKGAFGLRVLAEKLEEKEP